MAIVSFIWPAKQWKSLSCLPNNAIYLLSKHCCLATTTSATNNLFYSFEETPLLTKIQNEKELNCERFRPPTKAFEIPCCFKAENMCKRSVITREQLHFQTAFCFTVLLKLITLDKWHALLFIGFGMIWQWHLGNRSIWNWKSGVEVESWILYDGQSFDLV